MISQQYGGLANLMKHFSSVFCSSFFCCYCFRRSHSVDFSANTHAHITTATNFLCCVHRLCVCIISFFFVPLFSSASRPKRKQLCTLMGSSARSHQWLTIQQANIHIFNALKPEMNIKEWKKKKIIFFCISGGFLRSVSSSFCSLLFSLSVYVRGEFSVFTPIHTHVRAV